MRARLEGGLAVLGSAPPALESYANARAGKYELVELPRRISDAGLPAVELVDMRTEPPGERILSGPLRQALGETLGRGEQVLLDSDLARFYGVTTNALNRAVERNKHRFPPDFAYRLTLKEFTALKSQSVTSKTTGRGGRRNPPLVFTEHGAA